MMETFDYSVIGNRESTGIGLRKNRRAGMGKEWGIMTLDEAVARQNRTELARH